MRRRDFIAGLGVAAAWPVAAGAQTRVRLATIGFLAAGKEGASAPLVAAFHRGLGETGRGAQYRDTLSLGG
jgi:hypothetical protein